MKKLYMNEIGEKPKPKPKGKETRKDFEGNNTEFIDIQDFRESGESDHSQKRIGRDFEDQKEGMRYRNDPNIVSFSGRKDSGKKGRGGTVKNASRSHSKYSKRSNQVRRDNSNSYANQKGSNNN